MIKWHSTLSAKLSRVNGSDHGPHGAAATRPCTPPGHWKSMSHMRSGLFQVTENSPMQRCASESGVNTSASPGGAHGCECPPFQAASVTHFGWPLESRPVKKRHFDVLSSDPAGAYAKYGTLAR